MYKDVWAASIGEVLMCEREPYNALDRYAVAVKSVFALFATRGDDRLHSDWNEKILR